MNSNPNTTKTEAPASHENASALWGLVGIALIIGIVYGAVILFDLIAPDSLPARRNPNFIDNIFDSTAVVGAARILLIVAAVLLMVFATYTIGSMFVRMRQGEWLKEGGPFKAHVQEAESFLEEAQAIYEAYTQQVDENEVLAERLSDASELAEELITENLKLRDQLGIGDAEIE